ncbi:MAG: di-trans,poly-cis-decaprenylcistransferase [bacterium]|nr:MAG: di-trans,poly-cis-decaprenylcistransferase [bacterium]
MDGNGRWAKARGLPRIAGHRAGVKAVRAVVEECARAGVEYLTLFAFSRENWRRPEDEVNALMVLLEQYLERELDTIMKNNIRLRTIGRIEEIPEDVRRTLSRVTDRSAGNDGLTLILALSYSGRQDIVDAARRWSEEVARSGKTPDALSEEDFSGYLSTSGIPDPDLIIRTSGEMRISNFLLWQAAYAEFFVTEKLWPDFTVDDLREAIRDFGGRERRFGMTSDQVKEETESG